MEGVGLCHFLLGGGWAVLFLPLWVVGWVGCAIFPWGGDGGSVTTHRGLGTAPSCGAAPSGGAGEGLPRPCHDSCHRALPAVGALLSAYGWYLLLACVAIYLLVQKVSESARARRRSRPDPPGAAAGACPLPRRLGWRETGLGALKGLTRHELPCGPGCPRSPQPAPDRSCWQSIAAAS